MNYGKLVKRSGIVLLIVSIILLLITVLCIIAPILIGISLKDVEDNIGKIFVIIFYTVFLALFIIVGIVSLIFGIMNLITSITLLKSGTDINIIKNKRKRIIFSAITLIVTTVVFFIAGIILLFSKQIFGLLPLCISIVTLVLFIIIIKTIKFINTLRNEETIVNKE